MSFQRFCLLLALLAVLSAFPPLSGRTWAECPPKERILGELASRAEKIEKIKGQLESLLLGARVAPIRPEALLIADLDNPRAVKRRTEELKEKLRKSGASPAEPDLLLRCALEDPQTRDAGEAFLQLEREVDVLRLQFLELPEPRRRELLHVQAESLKGRGEIIRMLLENKTRAMEELGKARIQLKVAELLSISASSESLKDLAAERVVLEKAKTDILNRQLRWYEHMEERADFYWSSARRVLEIEGESFAGLGPVEIARRISLSRGVALRKKSPGELQRYYKDVAEIWRTLVDNAYRNTFESFYRLQLPELPRLPQEVLASTEDAPEAEQYRESYQKALDIVESFRSFIVFTLSRENLVLSSFIITASHVRSDLVSELLSRGDYHSVLSGPWVEDFRRELVIVPYRLTALFTVKAMMVRQEIGKGLQGLLALAGQTLKFFIFLFLLFLVWAGIKRFTALLDRFKDSLVKISRPNPMERALAIWIQRLMPYVPWLAVWVAAAGGESFIARTVFSEAAVFLPYIRIYCISRIVRLLIVDAFAVVSAEFTDEGPEPTLGKVHRTARIFGILVFVSWSLIYAVESVVSRGLVYRLTTKLVLALGLLILAWLTHRWKNEVASFLDRSLPNALGGWASRRCRGRFALVWSLPAFLLAVALILFQRLGRYGERYEVYKKTSTRVLKRRLEMSASDLTEAAREELPEEYSRWFTGNDADDSSIAVLPANDPLEEIRERIQKWRAGRSEDHSLALHGERGAGKSRLLGRLALELEDLRVLKAPIRSKMQNRLGAYAFFENLLEEPLEDAGASLSSADAKMPKTVVLMDDAHNLFLAKLGGFEAYKVLLELMGASTRNLFWCVAFNRHSWAYLDCMFGKRRCFDAVVEMPVWSEADIRRLILRRHGKTGYRLSYDSIIGAVGGRHGDERARAEANFFRLLCQQCEGNPGTALHLWLSSLRVGGPGLVSVGLPEDFGDSLYGRLREEELFVYADIVRHGSLSIDEIVAVTDLHEGFVRQVVKEGMDGGFFRRTPDGRYFLNVLSQHALISFLSRKNFVYGK